MLCDKYVTLNRKVAMRDGALAADPITSQSPRLHTFRRHWFKLNFPIEYSGANGTIDEIASYDLIILYISLEGVIGVNTAQSRIRFDG